MTENLKSVSNLQKGEVEHLIGEPIKNEKLVKDLMPGEELLDTFEFKGKTWVKYDYLHVDNSLFSTCRSSLELCREARDKWIEKKDKEKEMKVTERLVKEMPEININIDVITKNSDCRLRDILPESFDPEDYTGDKVLRRLDDKVIASYYSKDREWVGLKYHRKVNIWFELETGWGVGINEGPKKVSYPVIRMPKEK